MKTRNATVKGAITVSKAKGKVTYTKAANGSSEYLKINKTTGVITVRKGTPVGKQKIKVKVTAAGNASYKKYTKTITVMVNVVK